MKKRKQMNEIIKGSKGITLIALVVTIVILLILATVTINMTMNQNGIFGRAKNATATYKKAEENETKGLTDTARQMDQLTGNFDVSVLNETTKGKISDEETKYSDGTDIAVIPAGFAVTTDTDKIKDGVTISDKENDTNDNKEEGNEYVWVPVASLSDYIRRDYTVGTSNSSYSACSEVLPEDEKNSVEKYHGFYIGKYESGIKDALTKQVDTKLKTMKEIGEVLEKKNKSVYNNVNRAQSISLANEVKSHYNYNGISVSKITSSYAWDSALNFIEKTYPGYATSGTQGNSSNNLMNTGLTTPVCGIYDMGGNVWEWTTETIKGTDPAIHRGGSCISTDISSFQLYAGSRKSQTISKQNGIIGFRVVLFL